jgi:FtsH-binding integral membrane protein
MPAANRPEGQAMAYLTEGYYSDELSAARAIPSERAAFIQRTYLHLAGAVAALIAIEAALLKTGLGETVVRTVYSGGTVGMLLLMVLFIGSGYLARWWAHASPSRAMQYAGLGLYVVVQAVILLPLLYIADRVPAFANQNLIMKAGLLTGGLFLGLTTAVFVTRADFSFMGTILCVLSWVALLTIIAGMIFGFGLGLWFSAAMIALAAGYIVYDTSNILHRYPTTQHVGAALELFASVALLFYYILRFMMQQSGSRD